MKTNETTYNGWSNYETWVTNLHFDGCFTLKAQELLKNENPALELSDYIKDFVLETQGESIPSDNAFLRDLIQSALSNVNYDEIARNYIAEADFNKKAA